MGVFLYLLKVLYNAAYFENLFWEIYFLLKCRKSIAFMIDDLTQISLFICAYTYAGYLTR